MVRARNEESFWNAAESNPPYFSRMSYARACSWSRLYGNKYFWRKLGAQKTFSELFVKWHVKIVRHSSCVRERLFQLLGAGGALLHQ